MRKIDKLLCLLGHEPTVLACGGTPHPNDYDIVASGWQYPWLRIAQKLLGGGRGKGWMRKCVLSANLSVRDSWGLAKALEAAENRQRLIEALLLQRAAFDAEWKNNPDWVDESSDELEPLVETPETPAPVKKKVKRIKGPNREIARQATKAGEKLRNEIREKYLHPVEEAKQRKKEWLLPLMWEAMSNIQMRRFSVHLKREFYRKAKDTVCFDCGIQKAQREMTYDHLRDKKLTLGGLNLERIKWRALHQEIGKCDVVCRSCHDIREYLRGLWRWEHLSSEQQGKISSMCYVEREIYYQVITRETENPMLFDAESMRKVNLYWDKIRETISQKQPRILRKMSFWMKVGELMRRCSSNEPQR